MVELAIVSGFALMAMIIMYSHVNRSLKLVDRFSDKIMSLTSQTSFASYATLTPTAKEEEVRIHQPNGKSVGKVFAGFPNEFDIPDHLEPI